MLLIALTMRLPLTDESVKVFHVACITCCSLSYSSPALSADPIPDFKEYQVLIAALEIKLAVTTSLKK